MEQLPKVLVSIIHQGWIRPEMLSVVDGLKGDPRASVQISTISARPYENSMQTAARETVRGGYDYLINFDHDNVPTRNPIDLIFIGKDIIGMPYPTYMYKDGRIETAFLAMEEKEDGYLDYKNRDGLQEVDAVASGALVVSRKVLETPITFEREWKDGFAIRGIDFNFCKKAKAAGFGVYAHYDYLAEHFKEIPLLQFLK